MNHIEPVESRTLSLQQRDIWLAQQLAPEAPLYNVGGRLTLRGAIDPAVLRRAVARVIAGNDALRLRLVRSEDGVVQRPDAAVAPPAVVDLSAITAAEERAERLMRQELRRCFDLDGGALCRFVVLRVSAREHHLLGVFHHLIIDGVGIALFGRQVAGWYEALDASSSAAEPEAAPSFLALRPPEAPSPEASRYWRQRLAELPPPLFAAPSEDAASRRLRLSVADLGLDAAALPHLVPAALAVLLQRTFHRRELLLGIATHNRRNAAEKRTLGLFVGLLPLPISLPPDEASGSGSVDELTAAIKAELRAGYRHRRLAADGLLRELAGGGRRRLFEVVVSYEPQTFPLRLGAAEAEVMALSSDASAHPLSVTVRGLRLDLEAQKVFFDRTGLQRLGARLRRLLGAMAARPAAPISELETLEEAERHQLLVEWSDADDRGPAAPLVDRLVVEQVDRRGDAIAIYSSGGALSYRELGRRAARLAARLAGRGLGREDRVAVLLERSPELAIAWLAILEAGAACVPLDPQAPPARLEYQLADAAATVVLTDRGAAGAGAEGIGIDDVGLTSGAAERVQPAGEKNLAYMIYTSGSTGRPKGAQLVHRGLAELVAWHLRSYRLGLDDRCTLVASPSFDASVWELWPPLCAGAALVIPEPAAVAEPQRLIDALERRRVTVAFLPTPLAEAVLARLDPLHRLALRALLVGGDRLHRAPDPAPEFELINHYGPTECTVVATASTVGIGDGPPPIGRPIAARRVHLLDPALRPVPIGSAGHLHLAGPGLARGYWQRPALTAASFIPNPFGAGGERLYRSGDLGRWRGDGQIEFLGRIDHQVQLRGLRIEIGEIEAVLGEHPAVESAAVILRDERLIAYVTGERLGDALAEVTVHLRHRLPDSMVPALVVVDALPMLPSAKVDRAALARLALPEGTAHVAPRTPTEELLCDLFAELLERDRVGIDDSFFDLGGHSLLAARAIARIRELLGVELPLGALFDAPRVADLAGRVETARRGGEVHPAPPLVRTGGESAPLSFAQQRLWLIHRLDPASALYNIPAAIRLEGRLDVAALEHAFAELVRRHEVLRTRFEERDGGTRQVIHEPSAWTLPLVDVGVLDDDGIRRLIDAEAARPFDLERGPLLRVQLLRRATDDHLLLVTLHHIVADGWSIEVMLREIAALYRGRALPEPTLQYADFARWQRRWLHGEVLERQLDHWRRQLAGVAPLALPTDRPRPPVASQRGDVVSARLPAELVRDLDALGRAHGSTLFLTLLAAFGATLQRFGAGDNLAIGIPAAGRTHRALEDLIGFFVNTLALRQRPASGSFVESLQRSRQTLLDAHQHQDAPFDQLVSALGSAQDASRSPLFQVMFSLVDRAPELDLPAVRASFLPPRRSVKFDLDLELTPAAGGLALSLGYLADLFDATTMVRLLRGYQTLLAAVVEAPEVRLAELDLLSPSERHQLLAEGSPDADLAAGGTLTERFDAVVQRAPDRIAVCFGDTVFGDTVFGDTVFGDTVSGVTVSSDSSGDSALSVADLDRRSTRLARHLRHRGVGPEVPVALLLERSLATLEAVLAVLKAGGAYLPLDASYPQERLAFLLADTAAPLILTRTRLLDRLPAEHRSRALCLDRDRERIAACGAELPARIEPRNLAYLIYTSGSTGVPKGVQIEHRAVVAFLAAVDRLTAPPVERVVLSAPLIFDASVEQWGQLLAGRTLLLPDEELGRETELFLAWLDEQRAELLNATPSRLQVLIDAGLLRSRSLVQLVAGGEEVPPALWSTLAAHRAAAFNRYGPTEATVDATSAPIEPGSRPNLGRPLDHVVLRVASPALRLQPTGVAGELLIGGGALARGYLGRPARTARSFVPDPWRGGGRRLYRSGDLCRRLAGGEIAFLGRLDQQVKVRGFRIELGEVEAVLAEHPKVRAAAAAAREQRLVAFLVLTGGASTDEVGDFLHTRLPGYMVPSLLVEVEALPLLPSGKVDRAALAASRLDRERPTEEARPRTPNEEILAGIFAELLDRPRVGLDESFFELGGHSLLAARAVARIRDAFGVELPLRTLFEAPRVRQLAARLERASEPPLPPLVAEPADGEPELSFAQQRLWLIDRLEPGSAVYNLPAAVRLEGALDVAALERAFGELVRRHQALRTVFLERNGGPRQVIRPPARWSLPLVDLSGCGAGEKAGEKTGDETGNEVRRLIEAEAARPFDLARGPLLRTTLLRRAEDDHLLLVTMHHIVSDGWSIGVMLREIAALYRGEALPEPEVQYADHARWQRRWLSDEVLERQLAFWRRHLDGVPALELPADRPRRALASRRGRVFRQQLPAALAGDLESLARSRGSTLFMVLMAAFQTLLQRHAGDDFAVGFPIAGRRHRQTEDLIGFFVNTLALRADLGGDPTFGELLARVREHTLAAHAHQDLPFEKLVEGLEVERDLERTPIFQVMLALQNAPLTGWQLPDLRLTPLPATSAGSRFDLTVSLAPHQGALEADFEYPIELFDRTTIQRLAQRFETLLRAAIEAPQSPLSTLPLLAAGERQALLVEWNDARRSAPEAPATLDALFATQTAATPEAVAVIADATRLSYRELGRRAGALARRLEARGVAPEVRVGVCAPRTPDLVVSLLGVLAAGGAYVPIDPAYPQARRTFMLEDSGASIVLGGGDERDDPSAPRRASRARAQNLAYLIYTSGSTGRPKGVAISHAAAVAMVRWARDAFSASERTAVLASTSVCFDLSVFEIFVPLSTGGSAVLVDDLLDGSARDSAPTLINTVPSALAERLRQGPLPASVRTVNLAGEPLTRQLVDAIGPGVRVMNLYGPSEDTTYSTAGRVDGGRGRPSIGRPIAGTSAHVLDRAGRPLPVGVAGELFLGGAGLARGYLGRPALTAERFLPDPFTPGRLYRTGDRVRVLAGGELDFLGRIDHQVKLRGFRIELGEIEAVLAAHPEVDEAAVAVFDERLVAYLVAADACPAEALQEWTARQLPRFMVPALWQHLEALPRLPNGKVDRSALPRPAADGGDVDRDSRARTPVEELLVEIWSELLGRRPGIDDDFFALGGHSLLGARLLARLRTSLGVDLPLRALFETPTIAGLAARAERELGSGEGLSALEPAPRTPPPPLSLAQERLWFLQQLEPENPAYNLAVALRLDGPLEFEPLRRAFESIVRRHEILRSRFVRLDQPRQIAEAPAGWPLPLVDLGALDESARQREGRRREGRRREGRRLAKADAERPFDLDRAPMMRTTLVRLGTEPRPEHLLLVSVHHIAIDGGSWEILARELAAAYDAGRRGARPALPELPLQFADFAHWQRQQLANEAFAADLAWWKEHLGSPVPVLELPRDRSRRGRPRGGEVTTRLPAEVGAGLARLGLEAGTTLYMTLLAAFMTLLHRLSAQDDVVVGSSIGQRRRSELEDLIGFFVNTVALRGRFAAGEAGARPRFVDLLAQVRAFALGAYAHQDAPFEKLVEALAPNRGAGNPLFQVFFVLLDEPGRAFRLPDLEITPLTVPDKRPMFDLMLIVNRGADERLSLHWSFDRGLFEEVTIERWARGLEELLRGVVEDPTSTVDDLTLEPVPRPGIERLTAGDGDGDLPVSPHQQRLWFIDRFETGTVYDTSPVYHNLPLLLELEGRVSPAALEASLQRAVARHEVLRTLVITVERQPRQRVLPAARVELERRPATDLETAIEAALDDAARPFRLGRDLPLRATLYEIVGDRALLLLTVHHIAADRRSLALLAGDLARFWSADRAAEPASPPFAYKDIARWQSELDDRDLAPLLTYWRYRLHGRLAALELPEDRPRPAVHTFTAARAELRLERRLVERLRTLGASDRAVLFAAFTALLHRYTGQDEIVFGTSAAADPEFASLVGPLANLLVLRFELPSNPRFSTLVEKAGRLLEQAWAHRAMPFDRLVQALDPEKDMSRTALFDVLFEVADEPAPSFELGEARGRLIDLNVGYGKYDLNLFLQPAGGGFDAAAVYNADIYDRSTIERLLRHFRTGLEALVGDPEQGIFDYRLLTEAEERALLGEEEPVDYPRRQTLHGLFAERVAERPESVAVSFGAEHLSYRRLGRGAERVAGELLRRGIGERREALVAVCAERSPAMIVALLGVLEAGGAYLPIDPAHPQERRQFMLEDSGARLLLATGELLLAIGEPPARVETVRLDALAAGIEAPERGTQRAPAVGPRSLAYCLYTSGSTGRPKGVLVEHRNVVRLLVNSAMPFAFSDADAWTLFHSYSFDFSVWEMFGALLYGGRLVIVPAETTRDPARFHDLLVRQRVTVLNQTPSAFDQLSRVTVEKGAEKLALRDVIFGGEALDPSRLAAWQRLRPGDRLINMYGITETTVHVTWKEITPREARDGASNIGVAIPTTTVQVMDERQRLLPIGVAGEICVGGDGVARGYLQRDELTRERFVADPYRPGERLYRSGDLARRLENGELVYLGRIDDQVKIRGFRIELGEICNQLLRHPAVADAVVVSRAVRGGDAELVAYAVAESGHDLDHEALKAHLSQVLPHYMVPAAFVTLEALPLTANGKVDRRALPAPRRQSGGERQLPQTATEQAIAEVWKELLEVDEVGLDDRFFDLGGHSLLLAQAHGRLQEVLGRSFPMAELYNHPTIGDLARHLHRDGEPAAAEPAERPAARRRRSADGDSRIAIVGLAGRFPKAADLDAFWRNLVAGRECLTTFAPAELHDPPVAPERFDEAGYVPVGGVLEDAECFDAAFFGLSPRDAEMMDPQQRLFLETAWQALEDAGYDSETFPGTIGVYGGSSVNSYLLHNLLPAARELGGGVGASIGHEADHLTTMTAYKLGLEGPAVTVQTACSTSLVAVHMACRSLLGGEVEMALAGGVGARFPQRSGYFHEGGGFLSIDGHCRAFDHRAAGVVPGSGVGVVVLKRLADALEDGDSIRAVILGTAVNNDGSRRVGYTAPRADGQTRAMREAQRIAGVDPRTLDCVEAHGSATLVGDPVEVAALSQSLRAAGAADHGFCALGSVKTNIGHAGAAAGVAGLLKVVLALEHQKLPPSLHFEKPHPAIGLEESPFYVPTEARPWPRRERPRRAAVNSLGLGGTNAHAVIEEAPLLAPSGPSREWQVVVLSARSPSALEAATDRLVAHLEARPGLDLADVAYTLQTGRRAFEFRRAVVCRSLEEARAALAERDPVRLLDSYVERGERSLAFLLPGLGEQTPGMAKELYDREPVFRDAIDRCAELLEPHLGCDLRELLYEEGAEQAAAAKPDLRRLLGRGQPAKSDAACRLDETRFAQPAMFATEYALARLWMSWGVVPQALIGYSLGEYVAACLAGVFELEDALRLVAERARMIHRLPAGKMLAVALPEAEIEPWLGPGLSLAAVNGPAVVVVAGTAEAVDDLERRLGESGHSARPVATTHAFHSTMMEPLREPLTRLVAGLELQPPRIPYLSNVTGTWIGDQEATDPAYWAQHLCRPVRFADGVETLWRQRGRILLEVGPGQSLGALALLQPAEDDAAERVVLASLGGAWNQRSDQALMLETLAKLWLAGLPLDGNALAGDEQRRRLPLPTYPFERQRYYVEPPRAGEQAGLAASGLAASGLVGLAAPAAEAARPIAAERAELRIEGPSLQISLALADLDEAIVRRLREDPAGVALLLTDTSRRPGGDPASAAPAPGESAAAGALHARPNLRNAYVAPRSDDERRVAEIWQRVLRIGEIGVHDNFFALGGHSLLGTQVITRLRDDFGVELPLASLFELPTVAEMAAALAGAGASQLPPIARRQLDGAPERRTEAPLSFTQKRLFILDQLEPGNPAFNLLYTFRIAGRLEIAPLGRALSEVERRHDALRTTFRIGDSEPLQVIAEARPVRLPLIDLDALEPARRRREARRLAQDDALRPFDLARRCARYTLIAEREDEHLLLLNVHHIVTDGWSTGVLMRELSELYQAFVAGRPSPLAELEVQYADYAVWQWEVLWQRVLEVELPYWRQQLAAPLPVLELPTDRPRPAVRTFDARRLPITLERRLVDRLEALAQSAGATPFMVVLAALKTLLYRYTGTRDVLIGTPIAGRIRPELEPMIGFFVNTLVMRTDLGGRPAFGELLDRVRQTTLDAYAHQNVPFERLVSELLPERDLANTPFFQVFFAWQNQPLPPLELPDLTFSLVEQQTVASQFDLVLVLEDRDGVAGGWLEYNTDLFDRSTVRRMAAHLDTLLEGVVDDPARTLARLPLLPDGERRQLLGEWNDTAVEPSALLIHQQIAEQARRTPDAIAVVCDRTATESGNAAEDHLSYRALVRWAGRLARRLHRLGVLPEDRVGISIETSCEALIAVLGVLEAGAAYVPLDPTYPEERLAFMLEDSGVEVLLTRDRYRASLPAHGTAVDLEPPFTALADLDGAEAPAVRARGGNLAYQIYTSGSTGRPKGVLTSHQSLADFSRAFRRALSVRAGDRFLMVPSLSFDASAGDIFPALTGGATLLVHPDPSALSGADLERLCDRQRVTLLDIPAAFWAQWVEAMHLEERRSRLPALERIVVGGEGISRDRLRTWAELTDHRVRLSGPYGPTEATVCTSLYHTVDGGELRAIRPRSSHLPIGRTIAGDRVYLVDREGVVVPIGVTGELLIGGRGLARGYRAHPHTSAEVFIPDPFSTEPGARLYRTGDLARRLADGNLEFLGRGDQQIKIRGFRIELSEIESVLAQHEAVADAAVLAREDAGKKRLVAWVAGSPDPAELRAHLASRLPDYMVPSLFIVVETLPVTPNGKVDRAQLARQPLPEKSAEEGSGLPPQTARERILAGIWSEVLAVEEVGANANFFELGGDSILSLQVIARAQQAGLKISPKQLFQHQTVSELAAVAEASDDFASSAEQGIVEGPVPLLPIQRWFFELELTAAHHWNQSLLLRARQALDPAAFLTAVDHLVTHHDALRLRFERCKSEEGEDGDDGWRQHNAGLETAPGRAPGSCIDLCRLDEADRKRALATAAGDAQASLDLERGPIVRCVYFDLGDAYRVLIAVHHLAVDGVSFRILLDDLGRLYELASAGETPRLLPKTTSYKAWAERLAEHARSDEIAAEIEHWLGTGRDLSPLPVDHPQGRNTVGSSEVVLVPFTPEETRALLEEVPEVYHTQINDILLTALARCFAAWTGEPALLVDLEGHGREDLFPDIDLSRTVGWFTSSFPVLLELAADGDPATDIKRIKEGLRAVPQRGIGYGLLRYLRGDREVEERLAALPHSQVAFTYLGRFDQVFSDGALFSPAEESGGATRDAEALQPHLLEIGGSVVGGRLQMNWTYSANLFRRATVEALAAGFGTALRDLIAHCQNSAGGYTPSDFDKVDLEQQDLDELAAILDEIEAEE